MDGSVEFLKACLVTQGYTQVSEIDFGETFTPVIKLTIVHIVLSITVIIPSSYYRIATRFF